MRQFDFGENWREFSANALTQDKIRQAKHDFADYLVRASTDIPGKTFLDIGFGQGLSLLSAASTGAEPVGCDINPKCAQVLDRNRIHFPDLGTRVIPVVVGSILDSTTLEALRTHVHDLRGYDIVHSWGVLHHTGNMWRAIENAASLVRPGGMLLLAIYNRHWTSPAWTVIKRLYVHAPVWLQRTTIGLLYPIIFTAKWIVTGRNPLLMDRGMDFYYNVVDWVGGYPYEYASLGEVISFMADRNFELRVASAAVVPTGCNEYAFVKME